MDETGNVITCLSIISFTSNNLDYSYLWEKIKSSCGYVNVGVQVV